MTSILLASHDVKRIYAMRTYTLPSFIMHNRFFIYDIFERIEADNFNECFISMYKLMRT